jgi:hypothetical protein
MLIQRLETIRGDPQAKGSFACEHSKTESLGFNRNVRFSRCQTCGYVLVRQGKRSWAIPPVESAS